jgi:chromosome segregation ATPase
MSFLDRMAKAVSDTVDRGKRELDQMSRINRINGEIRELEKKIADLGAQVQAVKVQIGEKAVEMLKGGTLNNPDLQALVDQIAGFEREITAHQAAIGDKKAAIETIKAEEQKPAAPAQAAAPAQPAAPAAGRFCPQCGAAVAEGAAFCAQCGAKTS